MATSDPTEEARLRLALGWDVATAPTAPGADIGRDIEFVVGAAGLDLLTVSGSQNLAQQLSTALTSPLGGDPFDTRYGFDGLRALAEEITPLLQRERIRVAIIQTVTRDPRVRRIVDVRFEPGDGNGTLGSNAGARELSVRVEFETVTGDSAAVTVQSLQSAPTF